MPQEWSSIVPQVNTEAEFFEILNDFGDPLELIREALSNAIDAKATAFSIKFSTQEIDGSTRLVIDLHDNGKGMTRAILEKDFWGLGHSSSRNDPTAIGEKGHGTKIYLRSQRVEVKTQSDEGSFESVCDMPLAALYRHEIHQPRIRTIDSFREGTGTEIRIIGYNDNERSRFRQDLIRDYLLWFTKLGSIEKALGIESFSNFQVLLHALDVAAPEAIQFGHVFPDENSDIQKLFETLNVKAADHYVKRFMYPCQRLPNHPEITYDMFVSVEGDEIKRLYNPMLRDKRRADTGTYRVSDRYGLWLCKDYIPIERYNEWITGFGSGSNAFVLLHAFVNCQKLKLTANRKSIANTDVRVLEDLRVAVKEKIESIDSYLQTQGVYTLRTWQEEERTNRQEADEFTRRVRNLSARRVARVDGHRLLEPKNESELFGLFITLHALRPDLFPFEPLDYNTYRGIDMIARNTSASPVTEGTRWYVEFKYLLQNKFNHAFTNLRYIVCWDFDRSVADGTEFAGIGDDTRKLKVADDEHGRRIYFLDSPTVRSKIEIIRLTEYLRDKLDLSFDIEVVRHE
ncbi:MAG: hypothetical protein EG825_12640 [Rhodocyclaceae bacterium]|nr:hypothetical protein [Rhodocyclaceae bacterium]